MDTSEERLDALVAAPAESLAVELKRWLDPTSPEGIAKIARGTMALRNRNGGYLVIGIDEVTRAPDLNKNPSEVRAEFNIDAIQGIVSRYAHPVFEISIGFATRDGLEFPIIIVPDGTRVPVACRRDLLNADKGALLREDAVYFRTLRSNGTPSTSVAKAADWADIVEICFENREADIGRFLRRHIGANASSLSTFLTGSASPESTLEERVRAFDAGRSIDRIAAFQQAGAAERIAGLGAWSVALIMDPKRDVANSTQEFLNVISSANPSYTGWPVWLDSRGFTEKNSRPQKKGTGWQAVISGFDGDLDYQFMDARGEFYLWRLFQDDTTDKVSPKTVFDPYLMILRVAEVIAVGLAFAKSLGYSDDNTLGFLFKWQGLAGRQLEAWANREIYARRGREAYDDVADGYVAVPSGTASTAIAPYVRDATINLFAAFDGFEYPLDSIEQVVTRVLSRRW